MKALDLSTIVPEPIGGAHWDYSEAASILKSHILRSLEELKQIPAEQRMNYRIDKFSKWVSGTKSRKLSGKQRKPDF